MSVVGGGVCAPAAVFASAHGAARGQTVDSVVLVFHESAGVRRKEVRVGVRA